MLWYPPTPPLPLPGALSDSRRHRKGALENGPKSPPSPSQPIFLPPPSPPACRDVVARTIVVNAAVSAQISATTKRGCRPWAGSSWGPGNRGADLLLPPPPPNRNGAGPKAGPAPPPPPRMPSHPHCRPSHGDRGPSGSGLRATSMLGSGTRMVTQQVVLLSHTSEQVDPSTTLPPPPPSLRPRREGCTESAPSGPKSGGCEGLTA